jgi:hypothetical protein
VSIFTKGYREYQFRYLLSITNILGDPATAQEARVPRIGCGMILGGFYKSLTKRKAS